MAKQYQKEIVFNIVKFYQPIRTEQVKIKAMEAGISCADRYLRWLQNEKRIVSEKRSADHTKTWRLLPPKNPAETLFDSAGQGVFFNQEVAHAY